MMYSFGTILLAIVAASAAGTLAGYAYGVHRTRSRRSLVVRMTKGSDGEKRMEILTRMTKEEAMALEMADAAEDEDI